MIQEALLRLENCKLQADITQLQTQLKLERQKTLELTRKLERQERKLEHQQSKARIEKFDAIEDAISYLIATGRIIRVDS